MKDVYGAWSLSNRSVVYCSRDEQEEKSMRRTLNVCVCVWLLYIFDQFLNRALVTFVSRKVFQFFSVAEIKQKKNCWLLIKESFALRQSHLKIIILRSVGRQPDELNLTARVTWTQQQLSFFSAGSISDGIYGLIIWYNSRPYFLMLFFFVSHFGWDGEDAGSLIRTLWNSKFNLVGRWKLVRWIVSGIWCLAGRFKTWATRPIGRAIFNAQQFFWGSPERIF